jgi:hypothetical protein
MKFKYAPMWVRVVYEVLEWIDYKIALKLSSWSSYRYQMLDNHCKCEKCLQRRQAA